METLQERLTQAIKSVRFNVSQRSIRELVSVLKGANLEEPELDEAIREALPKANEAKLEREFPSMKPRCWKQKESGRFFKVVPWFQPIDNDSRLDFKALFKDLCPEFTEDILAEMEIYSGLVMHCGYQIYNDGGMWFCMQHSGKQFFEDLGEWDDAKYGAAVPTFPVTKEGEELKKAEDKKKEKP